MSSFFKRFTSALLAALMVVSMFPAQASAASAGKSGDDDYSSEVIVEDPSSEDGDNPLSSLEQEGASAAAVPTVSPPEVLEVTDTSITLRAVVTNNGGAEITSCNICYYEQIVYDDDGFVYREPTPTKVAVGDGVTVTLSGLRPLGQYVVYAEATNQAGTGSSETVTLVTNSDEQAGYNISENDTDIEWSFDSAAGVLTITGAGAMRNYIYGYGYHERWDLDIGQTYDPIDSKDKYRRFPPDWFSKPEIVNEIFISEGITSIGSVFFANYSNLKKVTLPSTLTSIGDYAFRNCKNLETIQLPSGLTTIGKGAFDGCTSLTEIAIPAAVKSIGNYAFGHCDALNTISVGAGGAAFHAEGGILFNADKTRLVRYPVKNQGTSYTIPDSVVDCSGAFAGCQELSSITIPNSVRKIGEKTFFNCLNLTDITIPNSVAEIGDNAFAGCRALSSLTIPGSVKSIGNDAFYGCVNLNSVEISEGVEDLGERVFYGCKSLSVVYIPEGVTHLRGELFSGCARLQELYLPSTIAFRQQDYIASCRNLARIYYAGTQEQWEAIEVGCTYPSDTVYKLREDRGPGIAFDIKYEFIPIQINPAVSFGDAKLVTIPTVSLAAPSNITDTGASLSAEVTDNGGDPDVSVEFFYFEKTNVDAVYHAPGVKNEDGSYGCTLANLRPATEYWVYARGRNKAGAASSQTVTFTTSTAAVPQPQSIAILPSNGLAMTAGQTGSLAVQILPVDVVTAVTWESSDVLVATVSQSGVVTAVSPGTATITVTTSVGRLKASCPVKVSPKEVEIDFSEWNLNTNTGPSDPDGGITDIVHKGGNATRAAAYLSRWDGPVYEKDDPYPTEPEVTAYKEVDAAFHVQEVLFLRDRTADPLDNDEIKGALMKYGAVSISYLHDHALYNEKTNSYYNPGTATDGGHSVTVVGWDDNYSAENFKNRPVGKGAFLCKNSWGDQWGDKGYFWISYYDAMLGRYSTTAVFNSAESTNNYSSVYYYDPLGALSSLGWGDAPSLLAANVFTASGNEQLKAVSFYTYDKGTRYEVYAIPNWTSVSSFSNLGLPYASGTCEYAGYHTVDLSQPVQLTGGQKFAVVVRIISADGKSAQQYFEGPIDNWEYSSRATANPGESWLSNGNGSWADLTSWDYFKYANFCIKAFTDGNPAANRSAEGQLALFAQEDAPTVEDYMAAGARFSEDFLQWINRASLFEGSDRSYGEEPSSADFGDSKVNFLEGTQYPSFFDLRASGYVTGVRNQTTYGTCWAHATMASLESCLLRARKSQAFDAVGPNGSGNVDWAALGNAAGSAKLELNKTTLTLTVGASGQLTASLGGGAIPAVWSSGDEAVAKVDTGGIVTAVGNGSTIITASADGQTATCEVAVDQSAILTLQGSRICRMGDVFLLDVEAGGQPVTWSSDNLAVATVNETTGKITAVGTGSAKITAASDGQMADCVITVSGEALSTVTGYTILAQEGRTLKGSLTLNIDNPSNEPKKIGAIIAVSDSQGRQYSIVQKEITLKAEGTKNYTLEDLSFQNVPDDYTITVFLIEDGTMKPLALKKNVG